MTIVLFLQCFAWVLMHVGFSILLEALSGTARDPEGANLLDFEQVLTVDVLKSQSKTNLLIVVGVLAATFLIILPIFMYLGLGMMAQLAKLPTQLREFRIQEAKCFCCSNNHRHPHTQKLLPCDRELVYRKISSWFSGRKGDDGKYLDFFNSLVHERLSVAMLKRAGGSALPIDHAVCGALACNLPWLIDFIPWWAESQLTGRSYIIWFLRGVMLWSVNIFVLLGLMRGYIILGTASVQFLGRASKTALAFAVVPAICFLAIFLWAPFRWVYAVTGDTSLLPAIPYFCTVLMVGGMWCPKLPKLMRRAAGTSRTSRTSATMRAGETSPVMTPDAAGAVASPSTRLSHREAAHDRRIIRFGRTLTEFV
mmetsp:Transcript_2958/g.6887  ORF Transcript_2958/g.6887 Transcript_2958/m.6887 type:complete len:367 (-) Transcript_2958:97-1197(-)